jgi:hypothetical protein
VANLKQIDLNLPLKYLGVTRHYDGLWQYCALSNQVFNHPHSMATQRLLWLDAGFSVDKEGLKPDICLAGKTWVEQAIKKITK